MNYIPYGQDYFSMMNTADKARIYQTMFPNLTYKDDRSDLVLGNYARNLMSQQYPELYRNLQLYLNQINGK